MAEKPRPRQKFSRSEDIVYFPLEKFLSWQTGHKMEYETLFGVESLLTSETFLPIVIVSLCTAAAPGIVASEASYSPVYESECAIQRRESDHTH